MSCPSYVPLASDLRLLFNSTPRFHPVEWSTGAAAGVAATQFVVQDSAGNVVESTSELYESPTRLSGLRGAIRDRHAPLEWQACPPVDV